MRSITGAALLALVLTATAEAPRPDDVPVVSYPELGKLIRSMHGKVVVVYFWADYCTPCKYKGLPKMKALHEKYGKDGLEVISVITDDPKAAKSSAEARKHLAEKLKVKFRSVQVDIKTFDYDKLISKENVPAVVIFNRDNLWVKKLPSFDEAGTKIKEFVDQGELDDKGELKKGKDTKDEYGVIEKTVADLLKK